MVTTEMGIADSPSFGVHGRGAGDDQQRGAVQRGSIKGLSEVTPSD